MKLTQTTDCDMNEGEKAKFSFCIKPNVKNNNVLYFDLIRWRSIIVVQSLQTDLEVFLSAGGGRCEVSVRATGLAPEGEARQGRPLNGSESGGAGPGFPTQLPPQRGKGTTCGPEPEHALKELAVGRAPPCWGCWEVLTWRDLDLSFRLLEEKQTTRVWLIWGREVRIIFVTHSSEKIQLVLAKQDSDLLIFHVITSKPRSGCYLTWIINSTDPAPQQEVVSTEVTSSSEVWRAEPVVPRWHKGFLSVGPVGVTVASGQAQGWCCGETAWTCAWRCEACAWRCVSQCAVHVRRASVAAVCPEG